MFSLGLGSQRGQRTGRGRRRTIVALASVLAVAMTSLVPAPSAAAVEASVKTFHFAVVVGAEGATHCDIVGDVYTPAGAGPLNRVPAVLMTHGFGQSKKDMKDFAQMFLDEGYLVLAYSGLGFGGSSCVISMDDPAIDGKAASQLVSYLGGADGIAYEDAAHTTPVLPMKDVQNDQDSGYAHDPRVGMFGASYGGAVQLAAASVDPRIDALVPMSTFNDLSYTLYPNNTAITSGVSSSTPGAFKHNWAFGVGLVGSLTGTGSTLPGCEKLAAGVCQTIVRGLVRGYPNAADLALAKRVSPATYIKSVHAPTLVIQSQADTFFNLNEGAALFQQLRDNKVPTRMIWQRAGHTNPNGSVDDLNPLDPDPSSYVSQRVFAWFAHYVRKENVDVGPLFAYQRNWLPDTPGTTYATSSTFPVGKSVSYYPSTFERLKTNPAKVKKARLVMTTPEFGVVTNTDPLDLTAASTPTGPITSHQHDVPGTALSWSTPPLKSKVNVAGSPTVQLKVSAPVARAQQHRGAVGQLVLFLKFYDVAPDGLTTLVGQQTAPVRIPDVRKQFTAKLPALVHQFAPGHRIRFSIAGSSTNFGGGTSANVVTFATGGSDQVITLPVVP